MAVVPRRRSLIGRATSKTGASEGSRPAAEPGTEATADSPPRTAEGARTENGARTAEDGTQTAEGVQTALHAARPGARPAERDGSPASGLEVFERARAGRGFEGAAHQDSYAMDDPPSEEVRLDPRFVRAYEPATELMDRRQLAAFGTPDSLTEDELDAVLPARLPGEPPAEPTPSPMSRGWIPNPHAEKATGPGAAPALPATNDEGSGTAADPATERISRDMLPPDLLSEKTVPSPFGTELLEVDDEPDAVAGGPRGEHTQPVESGDTRALEAPVPLARADAPAFPSSLQSADADAPTVATAVRTLPVEAPDEPEEPDEAARTGLPPLVGLVALVGSGGVIAGIGLGALVFALFFLFFSGGQEQGDTEPSLPPIEIDREPVPAIDPVDGTPDPATDGSAPTEDGTAPATDGSAPAEDGTAPATDGTAPTTPSKRRPPKPPVEPEPVVPEPPPPVVPVPVARPEPVPVPEPEPEPERKGPFGRGKKK